MSLRRWMPIVPAVLADPETTKKMVMEKWLKVD
jgi:hypothetical protein